MNYISYIIIPVLLLTAVSTVYCQYYKLSGTLEMYYRGRSTSKTNGEDVSSYSEFAKRISLQYPIYLWNPNFITISPSIGLYDTDISSTKYYNNGQTKQESVRDYKDFDYRISSTLLKNKGFPLSAYISQKRRTTNDDLFSDGDQIIRSKGVRWSFHINRPVFSHLPFFNVNYNIRERFKGNNPDPTSFQETTDYNLNKTFFKRINVKYNYSIHDTDFYKYTYHRLNLKSYNRLNKETDLNVYGNYELRDEKKEYKTYYFNSLLRYRPDKTFNSHLKYDLRINDSENTYYQLHRISLDNRYRKYLLGNNKGDENVLFDQTLNYGITHSVRSSIGIKDKSYSTSHSINSGSRAIYEKLASYVFLKPGYQLGLGYSSGGNTYSHSHKFLMGVDNRRYKKYFLIYSDLYYNIKFIDSKKNDITSQGYGYSHTISSKYIKRLSISMPLNYKETINSDNSSKSDFNTSLGLGYRIIRFLNAGARTGYVYSKYSKPGTDDSISKTFRARQSLRFSYSRLRSDLILIEESINRRNYKRNTFTLKFNTGYSLGRASFLLEYQYKSANQFNSESLSIRVKRKI